MPARALHGVRRIGTWLGAGSALFCLQGHEELFGLRWHGKA